MRALLAAALAVALLGCATHIGPVTVHPDGTVECNGFDFAIGEAKSCATEGGTFSKEFVALIRTIIIVARSVMPGGAQLDQWVSDEAEE